MQKFILCFFISFLLGCPFLSKAQTSSVASKKLREEKESLIRHLKGASVDTSISYPLTRFMLNETDKIYTFISTSGLSAEEREKAVWSLVYFIQHLDKNVVQQRFDMYDIPDAVQSYKNVLKALMQNTSFADAMSAVAPRRTNLISAAFSQYDEHSLLDDMAVYRRVAASPDFILQFLENKPGFRYTDSLLLIAAANDPNKIIKYLTRGKKRYP